jgi:hypothetical protein
MRFLRQTVSVSGDTLTTAAISGVVKSLEGGDIVFDIATIRKVPARFSLETSRCRSCFLSETSAERRIL